LESAKRYRESFVGAPSNVLPDDLPTIFEGEHRVEFLGIHKVTLSKQGHDDRKDIKNYFTVCWRLLPQAG
jgi:hypothetical protein